MTIPLEVTPASTERFQSGACHCLVDTISVALLPLLRATDESAFVPRGLSQKQGTKPQAVWTPGKGGPF